MKDMPRQCPACGGFPPSARAALRCWYQDDPDNVSRMSLEDLSRALDTSSDNVRKAWEWMTNNLGARRHPRPLMYERGSNYHIVLNYLRAYRTKRHRPPWKWQVNLARDIGISKQRVNQLAAKAKQSGHL